MRNFRFINIKMRVIYNSACGIPTPTTVTTTAAPAPAVTATIKPGPVNERSSSRVGMTTTLLNQVLQQ